MSTTSVKLIDTRVLDEIHHFPTVELIRRLFPDVKLRGRSVMCNPIRGEKHPSLSCFVDYNGIHRWRDFATHESGDNIDFFRMAYPELGYVEAVDALSELLFGRSALQDVKAEGKVPFPRGRRRGLGHVPAKDQPSALRIENVRPYIPGSVIPKSLVDYTRSRGISDEVAMRYLNHVTFVNTNRVGRRLIDPDSRLPIIGDDGTVMLDDGVSEAIGMRNDIGGFSLRIPETKTSKGFKGTDKSFFSSILSNGCGPCSDVRLVGEGDGFVSTLGYNPARKYLHINSRQGFVNVEPWAVPFCLAFLDGWSGKFLEGRELLRAAAVLRGLNGPVNRVAIVVEGLFDALSVIELQKMRGGGIIPETDIVVLNSISNISWAVPFLSMHGEVKSYLDNDMRSAAGQKAYDYMSDSIGQFCSRVGVGCIVHSCSHLFYPSKDINDYLQKKKGFDIKEDVASVERQPPVKSVDEPSAFRSKGRGNKGPDFS